MIIPLYTSKILIAIQAQESYCDIKTNEKTYTVSKNLGYYESILEDNSSFFRSHKSWIINCDYFISFSKNDMSILMENEIIAKLSRYRKSEFENKILTYSK